MRSHGDAVGGEHSNQKAVIKKKYKPDSSMVVCWGLRRCIPCEPLDVGRAPCSSALARGGLRKTPGLS